MNKILFICFLSILTCFYAKGQEMASFDNKTILSIDLGFNYSSFQDVKFSNIRYSGSGFGSNLMFQKKKEKYAYKIGLGFATTTESASTYKDSKAKTINANLFFQYSRSINRNLSINAQIDAIDFYWRRIEGLDNNSNYFIGGHHLLTGVNYIKQLNNKWKLDASLNIGVLSFVKESTSFAFSAPQNGLEDGDFSYQNEELNSPLGYKYFEVKHLGNFLNLKSSIKLRYKKRFGISYNWELKRFANVSKYPVTTGLHSITLSYNIISK